MSSDSDILIDLQLIGKYLAGEASPREALAIDRWREASPENNRLFESVLHLWHEAPGGGMYRKPNSPDSWGKLKKTIEGKRSKPVHRIYGKAAVRWKAAALIVLLIGLGILFYRSTSHTFSPPVYGTRLTSGNGVLTDTLTDSSVVTLFRHSSLSIHAQFAQTKREVDLKGEAYFSVKRLTQQPFIIYTGGIEIIVLGTEFNVKDSPDAVTVSVKSGKVRMRLDSSGITVAAGATGRFSKSEKAFVLYADSLNRNSYSYATGALYFHDASLLEIKEGLERVYGIRVLLKNSDLNKLKINTQFKNQSLDYVLKVICTSLGIRYQRQGETVLFFDDETL